MEVRALGDWPSNADMMADVAKLGYLDGTVFDATYGEGAFWARWQPRCLITNDLYKPAQFQEDYRAFPFEDQRFDVVVFDPPYKLSGTPALGQFDYAYGVDRATPTSFRLADLTEGSAECFRIASRFLLVKCQDQVVSGNVVWQTDLVTRAVHTAGGRKVDAFVFRSDGRPQPGGRRQVHARRNYSSLLVFRRA